VALDRRKEEKNERAGKAVHKYQKRNEKKKENSLALYKKRRKIISAHSQEKKIEEAKGGTGKLLAKGSSLLT